MFVRLKEQLKFYETVKLTQESKGIFKLFYTIHFSTDCDDRYYLIDHSLVGETNSC